MAGKTLSVVIIGPMGDGGFEGRSVRKEDHLPNLRAAVKACEQRLRGDGVDIEFKIITGNDNPGGDITQFVFLAIDQADIAIADISTRSPNVFYELSFLHALGRPTILVDFNSNQLGDIPHYVNGQRVLTVDDYTIEELSGQLMPCFADEVLQGRLNHLRFNAISSLYDMPLVDASAANGIATGYFFNFARWMIGNDKGVISRISRDRRRLGRFSEVTTLVPVRPQSIGEMDVTREKVTSISAFRKDVRFKDDDFPRPFTFHVAGPYIVDFVTPLESIRTTPSYKRLLRLVEGYPRPDFATLEKLEENFINSFFDTLTQHARTNENCDIKKLKVMTADELVAEFS